MSITIRTEKENIDWQRVSDILTYYGLSRYDAATQKLIFERSYAVAFAYDDNYLIGCARALSDGICQAAIYNVALEESYQGRQIGRALIESLMKQVEGCTVVLYTHPQTIALYETLGFRRQKTGFVRFNKTEEELQWMEDSGFLLPRHYRFEDNDYERLPYGVRRTDLPKPHESAVQSHVQAAEGEES